MLWLKSGAILFVWIFMIFDKVVTKNRVVNDYIDFHKINFKTIKNTPRQFTESSV
jgi:hypothetical protein